MEGLDRNLWDATRERAFARDGHRCTVSRLLGGRCRGRLHGHHIDPEADPYDEDNVGTVCAAHHPRWEALRRALLDARRRDDPPTCPHFHPTRMGREVCEAQLA